MNNNINVFKQLNTMILLTIITQVFVLIKSAIVASYFGISAELDAFNLANRISTFIYSFIGAGVSTVIIPYLRDTVNKKAINIFITVIYTIGFTLLVILLTFRGEIIILAGGSSSNYFIEIASNILVFTAITGFIESLIRLAKGVLEFNDKFTVQRLIVLFSNILLVVMLLLVNNNIYYYAFIILVTAGLNFIFHIYYLKKSSFEYKISYNLKNQSFKEMMVLFFPTMLSTGVHQISLLIDTLIAARLPIGSISTLTYANTIISMVNILLLGNITSFVYPKLVKKNNSKDRQNSLADYILLVNALMCFMLLLFYSSGREAISILFERGEFTSENTLIIFLVGLILAISLPTNAIRELLYRYFYINKDTFTPFVNSILISMLNIVFSLILSIYYGLFGVVIGTALASFSSLLFISIRFKKKFPIYFNIKEFAYENGKIIAITGLSIITLSLLKNIIIIESSLIGLIIHGLFAAIIYLLLIKIFRSKVLKLKL
ncbi:MULTISPECIES: murein biosynthesis integral membrane protein MurJ [unclassified Oceanobacillus]|uniref:murein biosynthesis integral membrane protein MurJ n=1 Tax=unclassified Oceanobacillus TaxID=2630292 RepID=UPI00300E5252